MNDIRFALRSLRHSPGVTAVVVGILALGIGAATAVFSVLDAMLLQPLPGVSRPSELVSLETVRKGAGTGTSYPDYREYRDQNRGFSSIAARIGSWVLLDEGSQSQRATAELVTGTYFATLGVGAYAGRLIDGSEADSTSAPAVAVISHSLWRSRFGSDPRMIGKIVRFNGRPFEIIGVTARDFHGTFPHRITDVYLPLGQVHAIIPHLSANILENRASLWLAMFARMKDGVTLQRSQSEMDVLAGKIARENPVTNEGRAIHVASGVGFDSEDRDTLQRFFALLMGIVGLLLAIVCANVANLLLARGTDRRREVAVRLALGASHGRLVRQFFVEGGLLAVAGALGAVAIAPAIVTAFGKLPRSLFGFESLPAAIDPQVLAFALVLTVVCTLAFSLAPALQATAVDINHSLKEGTSGAGVLRSRLPRVLVVLQVGISVMLLIAAGLMIRSVKNALAMPSGYAADRVLLASFDLGLQGYDDSQGARLYETMLTRLLRQPGIEAVGFAQTAPSNSYVSKVSLFQPGEVPPAQERDGRLFDLGVRTDFDPVTPGYFRTLSIARLRGRDFNVEDNASAPHVCILSQSLAQRLWPNENAIGKLIDWPPDNGPVRRLQVVGVVGDVRHRSPLESASLMLYVPLAQEYESRATIVVRYRGEATGASRTLLSEAAAVDRRLAVFSIRTLEEQVQGTVWQQRSAARLIGLFALVAMILAATGLYALVSYVVARRGRELGIRMALGARRAQLLWLVVRQSFTLVAGGIAVGLVAALAITRLLQSLLVGVSDTDALTFAAVAALTVVVGLMATLIPARRAANVDPLLSLRTE